MTEQERKDEPVASMREVIETLSRHRKELREVRRRHAASWGPGSARMLIDPIGLAIVAALEMLQAALELSLASRRGGRPPDGRGAPGSGGA